MPSPIDSNVSQDRRERKRLRSEVSILDAATSVFLSKGMSTTTMQDIAQLADVAQGTLYNYFPNKESLTISVVRRMIKSYGRQVLETEMSRGDLSPLDMIAVATILLISKGVTDPFWQILVERFDVFSDALHDELLEFAQTNLGQARKAGLIAGNDDALATYWRLGAWVIAGAIRDIAHNRVQKDQMFAIAVHVLMQIGVPQPQAKAIVKRVRSRKA